MMPFQCKIITRFLHEKGQDILNIHRIRERYFGDWAFYRRLLVIAVPIMIQNGITNFVSMLDNIMVGQVGTEQMSGVAIVNQLLFVYNLCIFGGLSGAGIFTAQYYGQGDQTGIRHTFRYKLWLAGLLTIGASALFVLKGTSLIGFYLSGSSDGGDLSLTLLAGRRYMLVMLIGLPAFMLVQTYASTLRECGQTFVPMIAGIAAMSVNLVFNYLLIYGKFGFPALGVVGAGLATALSRYVEMLIVIIWTHLHSSSLPFVKGLYRTMRVPADLVRSFVIKGAPLLFNETLWSGALAMLSQCYSVRGLNVVAGMNIANTINNVFNVVFITLGSAIGILMGQMLGAGKTLEAREANRKMTVFAVLICFGIALCMIPVAFAFPKVYNTSEQARRIATLVILAQAAFMPQNSFLNAAYFTIRSGGKTVITFFFDSVYIWIVSVPVAFVLSRFTALDVVLIFVIVELADLVKCVIGYILLKKGIWLNTIVSASES